MSIAILSEGQLFASRYRVERCIAVGGMGAVYEVTHLETERRRALKVMHTHLLQSKDMRNRFRREARVAAQIQSAFVVDVFDAGIDEATQMPFLVMELLQGEELGARLARVGRFGFEETVGYLWQTALALDKSHRVHIVHRDLKPENLFLNEQEDGPPRIKILDFGIAKLIAEGTTEANVTDSIGTPLYMAPEQFHSRSSVSPATDIFALGMMAYTMLVGVSYWYDEKRASPNVFSIIAKVMNGPSEMASVRAQMRGVLLPRGFDVWFRRITAFQPRERFPSATDAIQDLAVVLGLPDPASPGKRSRPSDARISYYPPTPNEEAEHKPPSPAMESQAGANAPHVPTGLAAPALHAADVALRTDAQGFSSSQRGLRAESPLTFSHKGAAQQTNAGNFQKALSRFKQQRIALFAVPLGLGAAGLLAFVVALSRIEPELEEPSTDLGAPSTLPTPSSLNSVLLEPQSFVTPQPEDSISIDAGIDAASITQISDAGGAASAPPSRHVTPMPPASKPKINKTKKMNHHWD